MGEFGQGEMGAVEVFGIGPDPHAGAASALIACGFAHRQGFDDVAACKHQMRHLAVAPDRHFKPCRQCIRDRNAHTMQAAGKTVGAALQLVELAASMQPGEHQLDHRRVLLRVQAEGDAAAVIFHADAAVGVQGDGDVLAVAAQGFVSAVVDDFLHDVQRVVGAGVHARPLTHGLQALEHADGRFGIGGRSATGHGGSENYPQGRHRCPVIPSGWGKCHTGWAESPDFMRADRAAQKKGRPLCRSVLRSARLRRTD